MNKERALELMSVHDLDAILATSFENVTYLTGHVGWAQRVYRSRRNFALLTSEPGRGTELILNSADLTYYATEGGYAEGARSYGGKSALIRPANYEPVGAEETRYLELWESSVKAATAIDALEQVLVERGLSRGRIAVDEDEGSILISSLRERLPDCQILSGPSLFLMIRLVKTDEELQRLRDAASVNERAMQTMLESLRVGMTENEAAEIWRSEVARSGAMWHWFHFGSGSRSFFNFPPTERKLQHGDLFMFDCGLFHRNYNADTGGCGSMGEPSEVDKANFRAIEVGIDSALEIVKEGVTGGQIFETMVREIQKGGMPGFNAPFAGHTVGLEAREFPFTLARETRYQDPFLPGTSEIPLPAQSTINIEAPIGVLGRGGYQIEKTVIVRKGGWEPLIPQDRPMRVIE